MTGRGLMPGVGTRHPVGATLPAMLQDDPFLQRFTAALDEVLTPVVATLDTLDAYVDPELAPGDFLAWLAGWVGLGLDPQWPVAAQRRLLGSAADVHDARGTARGLREELSLLCGADVEVEDPGGVTCSDLPGTVLPAASECGVVVRVRSGDPALADPSDPARQRLTAAARAVLPAHLVLTLEVLP